MTVSFKGEKISFWSRLLKKIAPVILVLAIFYFRITNNQNYSDNYKLTFYILGVIAIVIGCYYHVRDIRTVVTEVRFFEDKFQVLGLDFNSKFDDTLNINETTIEIKQKEKSERLYLEIFSDFKYYYINSYSDWSRETLINLVKEYQKRTNKTIFGEDLMPELNQLSNDTLQRN